MAIKNNKLLDFLSLVGTVHLLLGPSLVVAALLGAFNKWLRKHAAENPMSLLRRHNHKGILCMEAWKYVVTVAVQTSLIPIWIFMYFLSQPEQWWYGWRVNSLSVAFASILIGYYIQDTVTNWYENSTPILLHHIGTIILIALCFMADGWHGMFITVGLTYEMGSLAMALVDLGLLDRWAGPLGMIVTTLFGMGIIFATFWQTGHGQISSRSSTSLIF